MTPVAMRYVARTPSTRMAYYQRMDNERTLLVCALWDDEAKVWVAESDDVPGLATEADTLDALLAKLNVMVPELLALNDSDLPSEVPFELLARPTHGRRSSRC